MLVLILASSAISTPTEKGADNPLKVLEND